MGKLAITQEGMLQRFSDSHGVRYDYTKSQIGFNSKVKIVITCREHGDFDQSPVKHWSGQGCRECRYAELSKTKTSNTEDFSEKSKAINGSDYSYHLVNYVNSTDDVEIYCNKHLGSFWQTPSQHLAGSGCSQCAGYGYKEGIRGFVYILQCEDMIKVGITNRESNAREKKISQSAGKEFVSVWKMMCSDGKYPRIIERNALKILRREYSQPKEVFDGSTECFIGATVVDVIDIVMAEIRAAYKQ